MEDGGGGDDDYHVVTIEEVEKMEQEIKESPRRLNKSAGRKSCCIFRVHQSLLEINKHAYHPRIVSIGPYHHGEKRLEMIQEHKWRFLGEILARTPPHGTKLDGYMKAVASVESGIRESYSEFIHFSSYELIKMMVLDGLFVIELFAKVCQVAPSDPDDPLFNMAWIFSFFMRDLLKLQNQIPFFVLQILFESWRVTVGNGDNQSLCKLMFGFYGYAVERPLEVLTRCENQGGMHLLDLFRSSFVSDPPPKKGRRKRVTISKRRGKEEADPLLQLIHSSQNLRIAGIQLKMKKADSFLEIGFRDGVLEIPEMTIDALTANFLLNSVAFEQCYWHCSKDMTGYTTFMSCLLRTPSDVGHLREQKIMENYFGTDEEVANFFSDLGKEVTFDIETSYLAEVFEDVNGYCRNKWHVRWAGFKDTYFSTPWSFISALAAAFLLLLTMVQAFYAVYPYLKHHNT